MKVSPMLTKILNESFNEARNAHHEFFTPEHVLKVALQNDFVDNLLLECGGDNESLRGMARALFRVVPLRGIGDQ